MQTFLNLKLLLAALFVFLVCAEPEKVVFFTKSLQGVQRNTISCDAFNCPQNVFRFTRSKFFAKKFVPSNSNAIIPRFVTFEPSKLEYENTPCYTALQNHVTLSNKYDSLNVTILNVHLQQAENFYLTFHMHDHFTIPARSSITIPVVFVPTDNGSVHNDILIVQAQTREHGIFDIQIDIVGHASPSAYAVQAILNEEYPLGKSVAKSIILQNPQDTNLTVESIAWSGSSFVSVPTVPSLEQWDVPAMSRSVIMNIFLATSEPGYYSDLLFVNASHTSGSLVQLVIPVKYFVSRPEFLIEPAELDFGTLTSNSEQRIVFLKNMALDAIMIEDAFLLDADPQIKVELQERVIAPNSTSAVAKVSFVPSLAQQGEFKGTIMFSTNASDFSMGSFASVAYRARVYLGKLTYNNVTNFLLAHHNLKSSFERNLDFTNLFQVPVQFISAQVQDANFKIKDFKAGYTLQPNEKATLLTLDLKPNTTVVAQVRESVDVLLHTSLILHTNITRLHVPLHVFHGNLRYIPLYTKSVHAKNEHDSIHCSDPLLSNATHLQPRRPAGHRINFGILQLQNDARRHDFVLYNPNPIPIELTSFEVSPLTDAIEYSLVKICHHGSRVEPMNSNQIVIRPNEKAIMRVQLRSTGSKERFDGIMHIETVYEKLIIPIQYFQLEGHLKFFTSQDNFDFGEAFPGKLVSRPIFATNAFDRPIRVTKLESSDPRFIPVLNKKQRTIPEKSSNIEIGHITFDATRKDDFLRISQKLQQKSGTTTFVKKEHKKHKKNSDQTLNFDAEVTKEEEIEYQQQLELFKQTDPLVEGQVRIYTSQLLQQFALDVSAKLVMPQVTTNIAITFKITQIGTVSKRYIKLHNPSNLPVVAQLKLKSTSTEFALDPEGLHIAIIQPDKDAQLGPVIFAPQTAPNLERERTYPESLLLVRNNLTTLESIKLKGVGGMGKLGFEDDHEKLFSQLHFEIEEAHIGSWSHDKGSFQIHNAAKLYSKDGIVFTKRFNLVNIGNLPLNIQSTSIEHYGCAAFGIKIHLCNQFALQPHQRIQFKISYRPDYTTSLVKVNLHFFTTTGVEKFPLEITLPHELLPYLYSMQYTSSAPVSLPAAILGFSGSQTNVFRVFATILVFSLIIYAIVRFIKEERKIYKRETNDILPISVKKHSQEQAVAAPVHAPSTSSMESSSHMVQQPVQQPIVAVQPHDSDLDTASQEPYQATQEHAEIVTPSDDKQQHSIAAEEQPVVQPDSQTPTPEDSPREDKKKPSPKPATKTKKKKEQQKLTKKNSANNLKDASEQQQTAPTTVTLPTVTELTPTIPLKEDVKKILAKPLVVQTKPIAVPQQQVKKSTPVAPVHTVTPVVFAQQARKLSDPPKHVPKYETLKQRKKSSESSSPTVISPLADSPPIRPISYAAIARQHTPPPIKDEEPIKIETPRWFSEFTDPQSNAKDKRSLSSPTPYSPSLPEKALPRPNSAPHLMTGLQLDGNNHAEFVNKQGGNDLSFFSNTFLPEKDPQPVSSESITVLHTLKRMRSGSVNTPALATVPENISIPPPRPKSTSPVGNQSSWDTTFALSPSANTLVKSALQPAQHGYFSLFTTLEEENEEEMMNMMQQPPPVQHKQHHNSAAQKPTSSIPRNVLHRVKDTTRASLFTQSPSRFSIAANPPQNNIPSFNLLDNLDSSIDSPKLLGCDPAVFFEEETEFTEETINFTTK